MRWSCDDPPGNAALRITVGAPRIVAQASRRALVTVLPEQIRAHRFRSTTATSLRRQSTLSRVGSNETSSWPAGPVPSASSRGAAPRAAPTLRHAMQGAGPQEKAIVARRATDLTISMWRLGTKAPMGLVVTRLCTAISVGDRGPRPAKAPMGPAAGSARLPSQRSPASEGLPAHTGPRRPLCHPTGLRCVSAL